MRMMEPYFRLLLAAVVLLAMVKCGKSPRTRLTRCKHGNHKYYVPSLKTCRRCPACDPGWGLSPDPGDILRIDQSNGLPLECYNCTKCPLGKYSDKTGRTLCKPCYNCSTLERVERTVCSPTHNAVCGECKPMYYDIYALKYENPDVTKSCKRCSFAKDTDIAQCAIYAYKLSVPPDLTTYLLSTATVATEAHKPAPHTDSKQGNGKKSTLWSANAVPIVSVVVIISVISTLSVIGVVILRKRQVTHTDPVTVSYHRADPEGATESWLDDTVHLQTDEDTSRDDPSARHQNVMPGSPPSKNEEEPLLDTSKDLSTLNNPLNWRQKMHLRQVGRAWPDLARAWGLTDADVEYLRAERWESEGERIHQMILTWERKLPQTATVGNAFQGLRTLGHLGLAQLLLNSAIDSVMFSPAPGALCTK